MGKITNGRVHEFDNNHCDLLHSSGTIFYGKVIFDPMTDLASRGQQCGKFEILGRFLAIKHLLENNLNLRRSTSENLTNRSAQMQPGVDTIHFSQSMIDDTKSKLPVNDGQSDSCAVHKSANELFGIVKNLRVFHYVGLRWKDL